MRKHVDLVDLVKSFPTNSKEYLLAKIGVDTAENEPRKVHLIFTLWDFIFTEPPRPRPCSTSLTSSRKRSWISSSSGPRCSRPRRRLAERFCPARLVRTARETAASVKIEQRSCHRYAVRHAAICSWFEEKCGYFIILRKRLFSRVVLVPMIFWSCLDAH